MNSLPRRTAATVVAAILATSTLLSVPAAAHGVAASSCASVVFVGARGSGESVGEKQGLGKTIGFVADDLRTRLARSGQRMTVIGIPYRAVSTNVLRPDKTALALFAGNKAAGIAYWKKHNLDRFDASIADGAKKIVAEVRELSSSCPKAKIVVGGYSQGAIAAHLATDRLRQSYPAALAKVRTTVLVADGNRKNISDAGYFGSAGRSVGVQTWAHRVGRSDVAQPRTTVSVCNAGDIVCDTSANGIVHFSRSAAVHTGYTSGKNQSLLRYVAQWATTALNLNPLTAIRCVPDESQPYLNARVRVRALLPVSRSTITPRVHYQADPGDMTRDATLENFVAPVFSERGWGRHFGAIAGRMTFFAYVYTTASPNALTEVGRREYFFVCPASDVG